MSVFTGVGVALVTLFDRDGDIDAEATADLAAGLVVAGMQAVVVAGSSGEAATLTPAERVTLISSVRDAVPADFPVIAGTGAPSGRQAAELTRQAFDTGADAVLVLSPPWVPDPRPYYDHVAGAAAGLPVIAYHFPRMSSPGLAVDDLGDLPVSGVKDSSADPNRLLALLTGYHGDSYVGSAALLALAGPLGATGAVLQLANAEPEACLAAFSGDADAQLALTGPHFASRPFPHGIKRLVATRWGTSMASRL